MKMFIYDYYSYFLELFFLRNREGSGHKKSVRRPVSVKRHFAIRFINQNLSRIGNSCCHLQFLFRQYALKKTNFYGILFGFGKKSC